MKKHYAHDNEGKKCRYINHSTFSRDETRSKIYYKELKEDNGEPIVPPPVACKKRERIALIEQATIQREEDHRRYYLYAELVEQSPSSVAGSPKP